jgi:predicted dehydrogenase
MSTQINRRDFIQTTTTLATGVGFSALAGHGAQTREVLPVRVGIVGVGNRGTSLLRLVLSLEHVAVPAICDVSNSNLERAQSIVEKASGKRPEGYAKGEEDYQRLIQRDDLDAVVIATPWNWHTKMAVAAMKTGKYAGVEVPAAITLEECWQLVDTSEQTGVPCMMLENWSFRRDNLAVLNMIRAGLMGEIIHCHCAHSHNCVDHWFFDPQGNMRWGGEFLITRNADQYPTHGLGPVLSWMDVNCGDAFAYLTSTATRERGITGQLRKKLPPDHENLRRRYAQGDIVTTVVKTQRENTIVINYDMQSLRPYDNRWMIQGTEGIYSESRNAVYLNGKSPKYEEWESFDPYQEKYEHAWWKALRQGSSEASHGGTDYLELALFIKAVRSRTQTPIDVYDSVTMSSIVALSEKSISQGSAPTSCPDFTRGKWKTRKPHFAVVEGAL